MLQRKYCGTKTNLPDGYTRKGTAYSCLRAGIRIGSVQTKDKLKEMLRKRLEEKGLLGLKHYLHVNKMNKDELRSVAVRLTGSNDAIPQYWRMSIEQLRQALLDRGFRQ